nr:Glycosyltransferase [Streptococcus suis]
MKSYNQIDFISVVVPVYNVDSYLRECVDSLLEQTIDNYEIILVDDGSTDQSGNICDEYAKKSSKIKSFHKSNGGLSDARNFGVKQSFGNLITFVDSDDCVRNDYLELLYTPFEKRVCDLSIIEHEEFYENEIPNIFNTLKNGDYERYSGRDILKFSLLGEKGSLSAWGKMYFRDDVINNPFPKGELYEDMEVLYNILCKKKYVNFSIEKAYFYRRRKNSIVRSKLTERHLYGLKSCIHMLETEENYGNELSNYIKCRILKQACGYLPNLCGSKNYKMFIKVRGYIKPYIGYVLQAPISDLKLKLRSISYLLPAHIGLFYASILFNGKALLKLLNEKRAVG